MNWMQVYWVGVRGGDEKAKPGQFVYKDNNDAMLRGFIAEVDRANERILVYLFEPIPAEDYAEVVHARIEEQVWADKLAAVLEAYPDMKQEWVWLISGAPQNQ